MNKLTQGVAIALLATTPVAAIAATQTGNLNVTTTIQVSCDAPSPSGTLNLPFNSTADLDDQALAATPVTVSVTCYGNPTVNHVDFGLGTHRSAGAVVPEAGVRYMLRSGGTVSEANSYLGYKLWAMVGTGATSTAVFGGTPILTGAITNDNRLTVAASSGTFQVTGKVFEGVRSAHVDAGVVPGGTYNDIVVMTVDYN